ncbi:MAG TPA: sialidase family protein [Ktedonobacteraceae bacterium]|nr:sialidase family protein [Ktedonobacteraceae bacterium]
MKKFRSNRYVRILFFIAIALLLVACSGGNSGGTQTIGDATPQPVNGFGVAANHVHSLIALPSHVLVLATHYGIFRSQDNGATWQQTAAGPGQLMGGLMTYALTYSPLDPNRLYVLTQIATIPHSGTLGLYTSADEGKTWKLSIPTSSITNTSIFTEAAGNDTPDEVYIYLSDQGALGLKVSLDNGQHFSSTGMLPFGLIFGVLPIPGAPGQLLVYGSNGMARSTDGGNHWQVFKDIQGGIDDIATAGPHSPIYASGDAGVYASQDGGKTFKLMYSQASIASLTVSPAQPQVIYGKTGLTIYRSEDGGRTWNPLPHINGNLAVLAADPDSASMVYLSLSYPTAMYRLNSDGKGWASLTPPA